MVHCWRIRFSRSQYCELWLKMSLVFEFANNIIYYRKVTR